MSRPRSSTVSAGYSAAQRISADRLSALQLQQQAAQAQMQRQWGSDDQFAAFNSRTSASTLNPFDAAPAAAVNAWRATPPSSSSSSHSQPHTPQPPPHSSRLSVAYQQAGEGGYGGAEQTMQPRPPAQPPQRSQRPPPPRSSRIDEDSSSNLSPRAATSSSSRALAPASTYSAAAGSSRAAPAPSSLQAKVAAALQDLESIQSQTYRPSTAGPSSSSHSSHSRHGGSDGALPRPIIGGHGSSGSSGAPPSLLQMAKAASDARSAEELRTAKSIMKKLYKRNVKLMQEIKALKSGGNGHAHKHNHNGAAEPSASMADEALALESSEHTLLLEGQHDRTTDEEEEDAEQEDENDSAAADDGDDGASPRKPRSSKSSASKRKKSSASAAPSSSSVSSGLGGSSHLLFLLGERDTSLNKQQALISTLHRKCGALQAKLDLALGQQQQQQAHHATGSSGAFAALAEAAGGGGAGNDGGDTDLQLQSQLTALRARYTDRLRSQLASLLRSESAPPSPGVRAYISDLESWLLWESSWRAVEKAALNARVLAAERAAQESWVSRRLGESELHDARQSLQHMDAKVRSLDTQLAAALERSRSMEGGGGGTSRK